MRKVLEKWNLLRGCLILILAQSALNCPFPETNLENGWYIYQSPDDAKLTFAPQYYFLRFRCKSGYTVVGPKAIVCVDGEWTKAFPVCEKMQCSDPPLVDNSEYTLHAGQTSIPWIGSTVSYTCQNGFELIDDDINNLRCSWNETSSSAVWLGEMPYCKTKESCKDPGTSPNGSRKGDCCFRGHVLRFYCDKTFELVGRQKIICLSSGSWSSERPLCRPKHNYCEPPPEIPHGFTKGRKSGDYFQHGEEVEIKCEPGYGYNDRSQYVLCINGKWDKEFSECTEIFCEAPEPLEHGTIKELESTNATSFPYLFELTYTCNTGYRLLGGDSWRFCDDMEWSGKTPYCEKILCPDPGVPEYGARNGDSFEIGAKVHFKCFTGFILLGSFERYCMPNGEWSGELSRCDLESNDCPNPGTPISGMKNSSRYDIGVKVGFRCDAGHVLIGSEVRECLPNKTWSGTETKCLRKHDFIPYPRVRNILKSAVDEEIKRQKEINEQKLKKCENTISECCIWNCTQEDFGKIQDINDYTGLFLYFVFDTSRSVGRQNLKKSIEFAKDVVKRVGVSEDGVRVGAITFSYGAEIQFSPLTYTTTEDVLEQLDELKYKGGKASVSSALSLVREELIPHAQNIYQNQKQRSIVFILTDGSTNMGGNPKHEADLLKECNVEIFCISITSDVSQNVLYDIASDPKNKHVFSLENYATLPWLTQDTTNGPNGTRNSLKSATDNEFEKQKDMQEKNLKECEKKLFGCCIWNCTREDFGKTLDINDRSGLFLYFVFDVSGSVGQHNFNKSVEFAKAVVNRVGISENGARAGAITFSSKAEIQFLPLIYTSTEEVLEQFDALNYTGGGTSATDALQLVREECIPLTQNVLRNQKQRSVVFILTDGRANMGGNPKYEADLLKEANVEIYCIGITGDVSQKALYDIASDPKDEHVFILENYGILSWLIQDITNGTIDYSQCGLGLENVGHEARGKIVDGKSAIQPWPWMAAIFYAASGVIDPASAVFQCGGSIINEYYILTAAHCLFNKDHSERSVDEIIVKLGLTNLNNETFVQEPIVAALIRHENYDDWKSYEYDIALLQLQNPIEFNQYVRPICLPPLELPPDTYLYKPNENGLATGWGYEGIVLYKAKVPITSIENLKELVLPIQSRERCQQSLIENNKAHLPFPDHMFCAGNEQIGDDTCGGDSGGPLMQSQINKEGSIYWTQVGIISWGIGCGLPNTYGFYMHVQELRSWIDENMRPPSLI